MVLFAVTGQALRPFWRLEYNYTPTFFNKSKVR